VPDVAEVILVHGLWYRAWSMRILRRRLEQAGFRVRSFSYPTRTRAPEVNAAELAQFAAQRSAPEQHFLGHSLGGLLVLQMLGQSPPLPPGRVVLLGTPLQGSSVARRIVTWPGFGQLLGASAGVLQAGSRGLWPERETGMIAGTRAVGLGRLAAQLAAPHDGTVTVAETRSDQLADRIELPVTHTGMLVSDQVARYSAHFFRKGRFLLR
jgi:pimeloyl-ACP methyl ester carboxylesterase